MKRHSKGTKSTKHRKHKHHRGKRNDIKGNQSENLHNNDDQDINDQGIDDQNEDRQHVLIPGYVPGAVPGAAPGTAPGAPITGVTGLGISPTELIGLEKIQAQVPPPEVPQVGAAAAGAQPTEVTAPPSCAEDFTNMSNVIARVALVKTSIENLQVTEVERLYYLRKIEPLLLITEDLSITLVNLATTSNLYQANVYVNRKQMRRALRLAYDVTNEFEDVWKILQIRLNRFKNSIDPCE